MWLLRDRVLLDKAEDSLWRIQVVPVVAETMQRGAGCSREGVHHHLSHCEGANGGRQHRRLHRDQADGVPPQKDEADRIGCSRGDESYAQEPHDAGDAADEGEECGVMQRQCCRLLGRLHERCACDSDLDVGVLRHKLYEAGDAIGDALCTPSHTPRQGVLWHGLRVLLRPPKEQPADLAEDYDECPHGQRARVSREATAQATDGEAAIAECVAATRGRLPSGEWILAGRVPLIHGIGGPEMTECV
mmetsp:Transcript_52776/g.112965  ORF Transcript_52776/g.112965 Transcript_52776/m.112965 type:complete len:246 (+) Transcript_52776:90-827(+)